MSALHDISKLLGQWLEFTEAETAAIQSSAWPSLHEIQKAKSGLQTSITAAMGELAREGKSDAVSGRADHPFRTEVNRLISLEARNSQLLSVKYRAALNEKKSRDHAIRNLRKVRRSYGQKPGAGWHSFS
jgi:hypothetical protein